MRRHPLSEKLREITHQIVETYGASKIHAHHLDPDRRVPSRHATTQILERLFAVLYPGYHGGQHLTDENVAFHVGALLDDVAAELAEQLYMAFHLECERTEGGPCSACAWAADHAVESFCQRLPDVRRLLVLDLEAAYDGDPAARSFAEIILSYPAFLAITIYRVAHELHRLGVPLVPRIMTEFAHSKTGIDIHPGAEIGESFFIDHGTGVVIGETTRIGRGVKIYQGVTLGALSMPKDERGRLIRGAQRHPSIGNHVVIYAGATILGGETVIGDGAVVHGNTWVVHSIPAGSQVTNELPVSRVEGKAP